MNNLAKSLVLQAPPKAPNTPAPSPTDQISSARSWAQRALAAAAAVPVLDRTPECKEGCVVASVNLGDLAMMEGDLEEALKRYEQGRLLGKTIGFAEGIEMAERGIKQIEGRDDSTK